MSVISFGQAIKALHLPFFVHEHRQKNKKKTAIPFAYVDGPLHAFIYYLTPMAPYLPERHEVFFPFVDLFLIYRFCVIEEKKKNTILKNL